MRRAFSFAELLIALSIILVVAAISYPVIQSVKRANGRNTCLSNLAQIGKAILIYRESEGGLDKGSPIEMGLPPHLGALSVANLQAMQCRGNNPKDRAYYSNYPDFGMNDIRIRQWSRYVDMEGQHAVLFFDPNHQDAFPRSIAWEKWTVLGLRLDGSVTTRTRRGFPLFLSWWIDQGGSQ